MELPDRRIAPVNQNNAGKRRCVAGSLYGCQLPVVWYTGSYMYGCDGSRIQYALLDSLNYFTACQVWYIVHSIDASTSIDSGKVTDNIFIGS
jgi:hypothetical protein